MPEKPKLELSSQGEEVIKGGSGSLDLYHTLGLTEPLLRPLYFHHVPKTGGSSFRSAVGKALADRGFTHTSVPNVRDVLTKAERWPEGLQPVIDSLPESSAILSHYTSLLPQLPDGEVIALIREPEALFWSSVKFKRWPESIEPRRIVKRLANAQTRSLTNQRIPWTPPDDLEPWLPLVDDVIKRFKLFPLERLDTLIDYCQTEFGLSLPQRHKKANPDDVDPDLRETLKAELKKWNSYWLDEMLYERALALI
jgi:hypothetical protein